MNTTPKRQRRAVTELKAVTAAHLECAKACEARQKETGECLDAAMLQFLREQLWISLLEEFDPARAKELLTLLASLRREERADRKTGGSSSKLLTPEERTEGFRKLFGMSPEAATN
ncbi:MAG TPA: hypothetical protein VGR78_18145 [Verrucomicrobiae bacterium]|jgi:hypothetical protein|nr:hypothetical protein [Verrucomicrobiae bacterium]